MPHIFASLNFCSDCKMSIAAETIELYGKQWISLLSTNFIEKTSYLEEIYKSKSLCVSKSLF